MQRWLIGLALAGALCGACGDSGDKDKKGADPTDDAGSTSKDAQVVPADAGKPGGKRVAIKDAPNCAEDNPFTPGSECQGVVGCGGAEGALEFCPMSTHSCCVSGLPRDSTVNCYEGVSACVGAEQQTLCDGPEDCGGADDTCCVDPPTGPTVTTTCRSQEKCLDQQGTVLCHVSADCPPGMACKNTSDILWWGFCR